MAASKTAAATRPLRSSKRKSGGSVADFQNDAVEESTDGAEDAAVAEQGPVSKRRKLPVRTRVGDANTVETAKKLAEQAQEAEQPAGDDDNDDDKDGSRSESGSDSDDDAPEVISTSQAVAATRQSAQRATKAVEKVAADQRRRRQDRDARLKEQAATRKARQAEEEEEAKAAAEVQAKAAAAKAAAEAEAEAAAKSKVSKLLPLEFLESDDDDESDGEGADGSAGPISIKRQTSAAAVAARRRAAAAASKPPPRDRRQGTTVYRLLTDAGPRALAPKMRKHSRNVRQELLVRKRTGRPANSGFLVKR